jgi:hypothetical protein
MQRLEEDQLVAKGYHLEHCVIHKTDVRPCKGGNSNICITEGCFGEACREVYKE